MKYNNCLFWAVYKVFTKGGYIKTLKSKNWGGLHFYWISSKKEKWEFTLENSTDKFKWWYIPVIYKGKVRKIKQGVR